MKFASVYVALFLQVSSLFLGTFAASPSFCYGWECPKFQALQSTDEFEVRRYASANWASVKLTLDGPVDDSYLFAITEASTILKKYRSGENDAEIELNVTFPVRVWFAQRDNDKVEYVVSYFLPSLAQQHPPAPRDSRVVIGKINSHVVAVRSFRHGATTWNQSTELEYDRLRADLVEAGVRYLENERIVSLYDRRAKHTEVAFIVADPENRSPAPAVASLPQDKPDFCGEHDCPNYEVTRSTRTFDVRRYETANWAVVNVTLEGTVGDNYHKAWKMAAPLLLNYRNKGNSKEVKMAHTVPMLLGVDKRLSSDDKELVSFLFCYFIPFEYQDDVPDPTDKRIHIVSLGPLSLGVRSFSGIILSWDKQIEPQLKKLRDDLDSHGEKYHSDVCGFAQYNIFKIKSRHNEVALWLKEDGQSDPFSGLRVPPVSPVHPDFCGELDCPNFDVVRSTRTYDVRRYEKANWAAMNVTLKGDIEENYLKAWAIAAPVLLNYRKGGNMKKAQMAHTVPMLMAVDNRQGSFSNDKVVSFLFAYFIPFQFQKDVPEPNDKRISIVSLGPVNLGIRAFSGVILSWDKQIAPQLDKLSEDLDSHGDKYHAGLCAFAQYDVLRIKDRHNEVGLWLKEGEEEPLNGIRIPAVVVNEPGASRSESVEDDAQESSQFIVQFVPPDFCREHDCPSYDVMRSGKTFEIRKYSTAKWLTYNITAPKAFVKAKDFKKVLKTGMDLILDYNNGHNEHGIKVPMTVPVRIFAHERFGDKRDHVQYIIAFYIPVKFQSKPPKPEDDRLNIQELPELAVAVRSFHDASQDWNHSLLPQIDTLAVDLSKAGERYQQDHIFVSYYEYPAPRHSSKKEKVYSEVWLIVDE